MLEVVTMATNDYDSSRAGLFTEGTPGGECPIVLGFCSSQRLVGHKAFSARKQLFHEFRRTTPLRIPAVEVPFPTPETISRLQRHRCPQERQGKTLYRLNFPLL